MEELERQFASILSSTIAEPPQDVKPSIGEVFAPAPAAAAPESAPEADPGPVESEVPGLQPGRQLVLREVRQRAAQRQRPAGRDEVGDLGRTAARTTEPSESRLTALEVFH